MMGFGSSNLSQLAPPLTIDPSLPKPKPNQLGHFVEHQLTEAPPYTFSFGSSHDNWSHVRPPASIPNSFNYPHQGIDPNRATGLPSASTYGQPKPNFLAPQSVSRSYFPQYPSAAIRNNSSSMVINKTDFGMLSSSGVARLSPGGSFWNGISGGSGLPTYNSSLNQDLGTTAIQSHLSGIEQLNESNYEKWKSQVDIILGHLEYDVALLESKPNEPVVSAPESVKENYHKWIKANRMCILIIRASFSEIIRDGIPETDSAKELMDIIKTRFVGSTKSLIGTTLSKFCLLKFNGLGSVRDHILKMVNLVYRLKDLKMELNDDFLVHMVLNSLPNVYNSFKANYYSIEQKWNVNEPINECVQEEARLSQPQVDIAHVKTLGAKKKVLKKSGKKVRVGQHSKEIVKSANMIIGAKTEEAACFFCKKKGHMKMDCRNYKKWLENKKGVAKPTVA